MKKLSGVFICLLLFTVLSSARIIEVADAGITDKLRAVIAAKNVPAPGGSCDSCTGGLIFSIHFEADADVTTGSPCGCVDGSYFTDTTGTLSNATVITGADGYLDVDGADHSDSFGINTFPTEASMLLKVTNTTYDQYGVIFRLRFDADNVVTIDTPSSNDIIFTWEGNTTVTSAPCTNGSFTTGSSYYLVARWDADGEHTPDGVRCEIYDYPETTELDVGNNVTNLTAMATAPNTLIIGEGNTTIDIRIHSVHIWDTYEGAPTINAACDATDIPADCCTGTGTGNCSAFPDDVD